MSRVDTIRTLLEAHGALRAAATERTRRWRARRGPGMPSRATAASAVAAALAASMQRYRHEKVIEPFGDVGVRAIAIMVGAGYDEACAERAIKDLLRRPPEIRPVAWLKGTGGGDASAD